MRQKNALVQPERRAALDGQETDKDGHGRTYMVKAGATFWSARFDARRERFEPVAREHPFTTIADFATKAAFYRRFRPKDAPLAV
jgi:hypothetical protein